MKSFKKLLPMLLALAMLMSFMGTAMADGEDGLVDAVPISEPAPDLSGQIVILHTNDVHSRVVKGTDSSLGYASIPSARAYYESLGAEVILVDAGDTFHGLPIANLSKGESIAELMNKIGYQAMTPGNHDFNYTAARLTEISALLDFPVICSNYIDEKTGNPVFDTTTIITLESGVKVGFVGITTPETATKASPLNTVGYNFSPDTLYKVVQDQIDKLSADCDYVVALAHLGIDGETKASGWRSVDVIENTQGFDLVIDGHSHSTIEAIAEAGFATVKDKAGKAIPLTSTGNYLKNIGAVIIDGDAIECGYVDTAVLEDDAEITAILAEITTGLKPLLDKVVAKTDVQLNGERAPGVRTMETNLGNLAADALRYVSGADVALTNGGGIRISLPVDHTDPEKAGSYIEGAKTGDITYGDLNAVYPFGNLVVTINITGADLLAALEHGTKTAPAANGGFPQVSGVSFEVYTDFTANRVQNVKVNGEPLDLEKVYSLVTNDFTQIGGDGYDMLAKYSVAEYFGALDEALVSYVNSELEGVVGEEYAKPEGRIVMNTIPFDDIPDFYREYIAKVYYEGLMNGTDNGFEPDLQMTRGMMFTTLYRLAQVPFPTKPASEYFNDITDDEAWYADAAAWAYEEGITTGISEPDENGKTTYAYDMILSRQDFATMLFRYFKVTGEVAEDYESDTLALDDADDIAEYAYDAVYFCYLNKIINGVTETEFSPLAGATRAQGATMLSRSIDFIRGEGEAK